MRSPMPHHPRRTAAPHSPHVQQHGARKRRRSKRLARVVADKSRRRHGIRSLADLREHLHDHLERVRAKEYSHRSQLRQGTGRWYHSSSDSEDVERPDEEEAEDEEDDEEDWMSVDSQSGLGDDDDSGRDGSEDAEQQDAAAPLIVHFDGGDADLASIPLQLPFVYAAADALAHAHAAALLPPPPALAAAAAAPAPYAHPHFSTPRPAAPAYQAPPQKTQLQTPAPAPAALHALLAALGPLSPPPAAGDPAAAPLAALLEPSEPGDADVTCVAPAMLVLAPAAATTPVPAVPEAAAPAAPAPLERRPSPLPTPPRDAALDARAAAPAVADEDLLLAALVPGAILDAAVGGLDASARKELERAEADAAVARVGRMAACAPRAFADGARGMVDEEQEVARF